MVIRGEILAFHQLIKQTKINMIFIIFLSVALLVLVVSYTGEWTVDLRHSANPLNSQRKYAAIINNFVHCTSTKTISIISLCA